MVLEVLLRQRAKCCGRSRRNLLHYNVVKIGVASLIVGMAKVFVYVLGYGRELVCYVEDLEAGDVIRGDALSPREQQDLNRGRLFVRNLLEEAHASLLVDDLTQALQVMQKVGVGQG